MLFTDWGLRQAWQAAESASGAGLRYVGAKSGQGFTFLTHSASTFLRTRLRQSFEWGHLVRRALPLRMRALSSNVTLP